MPFITPEGLILLTDVCDLERKKKSRIKKGYFDPKWWCVFLSCLEWKLCEYQIPRRQEGKAHGTSKVSDAVALRLWDDSNQDAFWAEVWKAHSASLGIAVSSNKGREPDICPASMALSIEKLVNTNKIDAASIYKGENGSLPTIHGTWESRAFSQKPRYFSNKICSQLQTTLNSWHNGTITYRTP